MTYCMMQWNVNDNSCIFTQLWWIYYIWKAIFICKQKEFLTWNMTDLNISNKLATCPQEVNKLVFIRRQPALAPSDWDTTWLLLIPSSHCRILREDMSTDLNETSNSAKFHFVTYRGGCRKPQILSLVLPTEMYLLVSPKINLDIFPAILFLFPLDEESARSSFISKLG